MKKMRVCATLGALLGFLSTQVMQVQAFLSSKTNYFGPTSLQNEVHPMLSIMGPATLNNVTVTGPMSLKGPADLTNGHFQALSIYGRLKGVNLTCQTLEVFGPTTLSTVTVNGTTTVMGPLVIDTGSFQEVTVAADKVTIKDARLKSLVIKQNHPDHPRPQMVTLEGKTVIEGDVILEGGKKVSLIKDDEVKIQGQIILPE